MMTQMNRVFRDAKRVLLLSLACLFVGIYSSNASEYATAYGIYATKETIQQRKQEIKNKLESYTFMKKHLGSNMDTIAGEIYQEEKRLFDANIYIYIYKDINKFRKVAFETVMTPKILKVVMITLNVHFEKNVKGDDDQNTPKWKALERHSFVKEKIDLLVWQIIEYNKRDNILKDEFKEWWLLIEKDNNLQSWADAQVAKEMEKREATEKQELERRTKERELRDRKAEIKRIELEKARTRRTTTGPKYAQPKKRKQKSDETLAWEIERENWISKTIDEKDKFPWVDDAVSEKCKRCADYFGYFLRKHHCRSCGETVCNRCSKNRMLVRSDCLKEVPEDFQDEEGKKRVCDFCVRNWKKQNKQKRIFRGHNRHNIYTEAEQQSMQAVDP